MTSGGNNFSRTFQDLKLQFPGLSMTKVIFQDFPGPEILKKKSRTFPEAWEPCNTLQLHWHPANLARNWPAFLERARFQKC